MSDLIQDIRFGWRMMTKTPGFTLVAILTLALGIGANAAIFSVVNAAMIRPLPYPNGKRLMGIYHAYKKLNIDYVTVYPQAFDYYRSRATSFDHLAAFSGFQAPQNLTGGGDPQRVVTIKATGEFFPALGTQPMLGRVFTPADDVPGSRVVVLSYALWNGRFGGDRGIVGRDITLDGANYSVIGVMPKGFEFPEEAELWVPMGFTPQQLQQGAEYLSVIGLLKPGVSRQQAEAEMAKLTQEILARDNQLDNRNGWSAKTVPLQEASVTDVRTALWVLLGAVGCVLLIACANVANLLLARATARRKEIAIRAALGASRWRTIRQLLTEGVLLGVVGGALGLLMAYAGLDALLKLVPVSIPSYIHVEIDGLVLAFTFALAVITGILFSALPALHMTHGDVNDSLKEGGRTSGAGGHHFVRGTIVVAQLALAMVLLVGAGLLIKTFSRVQQSNFGFEPHNVLTFATELPETKYKEPAQQVAFFSQLLERERALPGVKSAATTTGLPVTGTSMASSFSIEGKTFDPQPHVHVAMISPTYFETMQIPVQKGRAFAETDREGTAPVAILDENAARAYFQGEDPIGKRVMFTFEGTREKRIWREIVGVVGSVKHNNPLRSETKGQIFFPFAQYPIPYSIVVLRTAADPLAVANEARREVLAIDPFQPVERMRTMDELLDKFVAQPRFNMVLLGIFAGLALLLSAIGVYGVMAYSVTQRTHEFGVRLALGATAADLLRFVLKQALHLALVGLLVGLAGAFAATRALSSLLFGVKPTDPVTFTAIAVLLAGIALLASYLPARRATKVDPMIALRYE